MNVSEIISACIGDESLPFVVIGGYAVIAHGYSRNTYDLDFLARRSQRQEWVAKLKGLGFSIFRESEIFIQFRPEGEGLDLDLMLVRDQTFYGMMQEAKEILISGVTARMASLDHILALKLHVIKQNLRHRVIKDVDDVIMLVKINGLDIRSEKYKKLFLKYSDNEIYEKVLTATD